jgi:hypothetical protein
MVSSLTRWIVSVTSILAHRDADLEWGGDHPISEEHGKIKRKKRFSHEIHQIHEKLNRNQ